MLRSLKVTMLCRGTLIYTEMPSHYIYGCDNTIQFRIHTLDIINVVMAHTVFSADMLPEPLHQRLLYIDLVCIPSSAYQKMTDVENIIPTY